MSILCGCGAEVKIKIDSRTNSEPETTSSNSLALPTPKKKSIFFVETPGGVHKVQVEDGPIGRLSALGSIGATVWTEEEWQKSTNNYPRFVDVVDRTKDWRESYTFKTNADGMVWMIDDRPAAIELLRITNVLTLTFRGSIYPITGLTEEQVNSITNAFPERAKIYDELVLTTEGLTIMEHRPTWRSERRIGKAD